MGAVSRRDRRVRSRDPRRAAGRGPEARLTPCAVPPNALGMRLSHRPNPRFDDRPRLGLVALSTDERIEDDLTRLLPRGRVALHVARTPVDETISTGSLGAMAQELPAAARRLPARPRYAAIAYGCTSGATVIGPERVASLIGAERAVGVVVDPLSATIAACAALGLSRIGFVTPYVASVSDAMRAALARAGIDVVAFGSFEIADDPTVARLDPAAVLEAGLAVGRAAKDAGGDGLFLACTNLPALDALSPLEDALAIPALSSNLTLAWALGKAAATPLAPPAPLRLTAL